MAGKPIAAFAIFPDRDSAERAVDQVTAAGFSNRDVSVLMSEKAGSKDFATEKNTKAPEGTTAGVGIGGVVGGTVGVLAGIGALAIPGVGPLIAAGPIMAALAGFGVGGALGGLVGALVGMGIPEYEAKHYQTRVNDGGILVSVHCDGSDELSRATDLLKNAGGDDVAAGGEKSASSHTMNHDRVRDETRMDDRRVDDTRRVEDTRLVDDIRLMDRRLADPLYTECRVDANGDPIVEHDVVSERYWSSGKAFSLR
jgi:hypothetical protein